MLVSALAPTFTRKTSFVPLQNFKNYEASRTKFQAPKRNTLQSPSTINLKIFQPILHFSTQKQIQDALTTLKTFPETIACCFSPQKIQEKISTPKGQHEIYHMTSYALGGIVVGLFFAKFTLPINLLLNVAIPAHIWLGGKNIIQDYAKGSAKPIATATLIGVTAAMTLGFLRLNLFDVGIVDTVAALWSK